MDSIQSNPRTPADLVAGFPGAGKTTFIGGYAAFLKREGLSPAVIVEELTGGCWFVNQAGGASSVPGVKTDAAPMLNIIGRELNRAALAALLG